MIVPAVPPPQIELPAQRSFKLLEAGKDPAPLRYALDERTASYAVTTRMSSRRLAGPTWSPRASLPAMTTTLEITSARTAPLALRPLPAVVEDGATPETREYLAGWEAIADKRVVVTFDERGQLGPLADAGAATRATDGALDDLTQRLLGTVVPLPVEPVGVGGSWRVVTILRQRPAVVKQTATYTLVERGEQRWKITADIQRVGEAQTVTDRSIPAGTAIEIVTLVRKLRGTIIVDPSHPLGTGELALDSSLHLRIQPSGQEVREEILEDTGTLALEMR